MKVKIMLIFFFVFSLYVKKFKTTLANKNLTRWGEIIKYLQHIIYKIIENVTFPVQVFHNLGINNLPISLIFE